jgi:hypothetical protein
MYSDFAIWPDNGASREQRPLRRVLGGRGAAWWWSGGWKNAITNQTEDWEERLANQIRPHPARILSLQMVHFDGGRSAPNGKNPAPSSFGALVC